MIQHLYYTDVNVEVVFVGCKWICPKRPEMTDSDEDGGTYCIYQLYLFFYKYISTSSSCVGLLCQGLTGSCQTGCQGKINPRRRFTECLFRSVRGLRAGLRTAGLIDPQLVIRPALQQLLPLFWILPRSPQ